MESERDGYSSYYNPHDRSKVKKFYRILLSKLILNGGKNLIVPIKKLILAARVYLKKPELLLLEEESALINKYTNFTIFDRFWAMQCTIMSIIVNMEYVLLYDRVYVLEDGRVVEEGDPKVLL